MAQYDSLNINTASTIPIGGRHNREMTQEFNLDSYKNWLSTFLMPTSEKPYVLCAQIRELVIGQ